MEQLIGSEQTVKTQKIYENDIKKLERAFSVSYRTWAQTCYKVKPALRTFCSKVVLHMLKDVLLSEHDAASECYDSLQRNYPVSLKNSQKKKVLYINLYVLMPIFNALFLILKFISNFFNKI